MARRNADRSLYLFTSRSGCLAGSQRGDDGKGENRDGGKRERETEREREREREGQRTEGEGEVVRVHDTGEETHLRFRSRFSSSLFPLSFPLSRVHRPIEIVPPEVDESL
jgi:hypothetical protein